MKILGLVAVVLMLGFRPPLEPDRFTFVGRTYEAHVDSESFHFESGEIYWSVSLAGSRGRRLQVLPEQVRVFRNGLIEEYRFEQARVEQLFIIPEPTHSVDIRMRVETNLTVVRPFGRQGLMFTSRTGAAQLRYYGAMAIDAVGTTVPLSPRIIEGEIRLEVPVEFVSRAVFPLTIDPWIELGNSGRGGGVSRSREPSRSPSLALDESGVPYIAWSEVLSGDNCEILVAFWNGREWAGLGGSSAGRGISNTPGISIEPVIALFEGRPIVAWEEVSENREEYSIYLRRWTGSAWEEISGSASGRGLSGTGRSRFPSMAVDRNGIIFVAWTEENRKIYLKRTSERNGRLEWTEMGGSATGQGISGAMESRGSSLALDGSGFPMVAYSGSPGQNRSEIYLKKFDGNQWAGLGGSDAGNGISNSPDTGSTSCSLVSTSGGHPIVAWNEGDRVFVKFFENDRWIGKGGSSDEGRGIGEHVGIKPSLAIDRNDRLCISYTGTEDEGQGWRGNWRAYLRILNRDRWEQLEGSATGSGIAGGRLQAGQTSAAIHNARPKIAFEIMNEQDRNRYHEIYYKEWNPNAPRGMGQRSVSGGDPIPQGGQTIGGILLEVQVPDTADGIAAISILIVGPDGDRVERIAGVEPGGTASFKLEELTVGKYRWEAVIETQEETTPPVPFGDNLDDEMDFEIGPRPEPIPEPKEPEPEGLPDDGPPKDDSVTQGSSRLANLQ
jgi:hypothetical protein